MASLPTIFQSFSFTQISSDLAAASYLRAPNSANARGTINALASVALRQAFCKRSSSRRNSSSFPSCRRYEYHGIATRLGGKGGNLKLSPLDIGAVGARLLSTWAK